jgi:hypothetical protein
VVPVVAGSNPVRHPSVDLYALRLEGFLPMTSATVSRIHRGLTAALVSCYVAAAIVGVFAGVIGNKVLWVVLLCGAAAFIVVGSMVRKAPRWLALGLISVGAIVGGVLLLPTVLVPIAAAILVALTFSLSRRATAA